MGNKTRSLTSEAIANTLGPLKPNEDRFRTLADHVPTMLWMTDTQGSVVYFNRRWLDFTGLTLETSLGDTWANSVLESDRVRSQKAFATALERRGVLQMEYSLRRHDGHYRKMLALGEPLHDDDGVFTGYVGCVVDITTQAENEEELRAQHVALTKCSREIELLNQLNDNLQVCKNIDETKPILKRYGRQIFPTLSISLCLFNESRNLVEPFVSLGTDAAIEHSFAPDECWALRKSKVHIELNEGDEVICPNFAACKGEQYLCVPMMGYGEVIGNLHLSFSGDMNSDASDDIKEEIRELVQLASMASDQIALALANLKLRSSLHYESTRDPLTQLFNRRYLLETLEREIARSKRANKELSVLVIDIDHFKIYNDTHGHAAGDHVLREFGALLRQTIRDSDIACRYGGEEFVMVLPECSADDAYKRAYDLRKHASELSVEHLGKELGQITISIGVSAFPQQGTSASALLAEADAALYKAKAQGRDRVVVSQTVAGVLTTPTPISSTGHS